MGEPAEVVEDMPAEVVHYQPGQVSIYRSAEPEIQLTEARARARVLVEVVNEQGLAQTFGRSGRAHVNVEGWTFLASQFGLIPDIEWTRELEGGAGWEARAMLVRISDGAVLTHAEAECRRDETKGGKQRWKEANSFEIRSMAQTRATSKVCRNALSSVMVLAGFAGTPAEEMDGVRAAEPPKSPDEPHCPACLSVNGELVAVTHHDKKPYWRCTNSPNDCGGFREHKGRSYSWSGWHDSFENSAKEWLEENATEITLGERSNYWPWILDEIRGTLGLADRDEAKPIAKTGLYAVASEGKIDLAAVLDEVPDELSDEHLAALATSLTPAEAQLVVSTASQYASDPDEAPV